MATDIANLKTFHNWIKRQLYSTYLQPGQSLVEWGCGRGGDLLKVFHQRPRWVLNLDVNEQFVRDGRARALEQFQTTSDPFWQRIKWFVGDLTKTDTYRQLIESRTLYQPNSVDVFSCQFSLSYFWGSKATVCNLLEFVSSFLITGGYFFGTMPDGAQIRAVCGTSQAFKSTVVSIELLPQQPQQQLSQAQSGTQDKSGGEFGWPVRFNVTDAVVCSNVNEYVIDWDAFVSLAKKFRLQVVAADLFESWYKRYHASNLSSAEMQASFLNRSFVFQKLAE